MTRKNRASARPGSAHTRALAPILFPATAASLSSLRQRRGNSVSTAGVGPAAKWHLPGDVESLIAIRPAGPAARPGPSPPRLAAARPAGIALAGGSPRLAAGAI